MFKAFDSSKLAQLIKTASAEWPNELRTIVKLDEKIALFSHLKSNKKHEFLQFQELHSEEFAMVRNMTLNTLNSQSIESLAQFLTFSADSCTKDDINAIFDQLLTYFRRKDLRSEDIVLLLQALQICIETQVKNETEINVSEAKTFESFYLYHETLMKPVELATFFTLASYNNQSAEALAQSLAEQLCSKIYLLSTDEFLKVAAYSSYGFKKCKSLLTETIVSSFDKAAEFKDSKSLKFHLLRDFYDNINHASKNATPNIDKLASEMINNAVFHETFPSITFIISEILLMKPDLLSDTQFEILTEQMIQNLQKEQLIDAKLSVVQLLLKLDKLRANDFIKSSISVFFGTLFDKLSSKEIAVDKEMLNHLVSTIRSETWIQEFVDKAKIDKLSEKCKMREV